jgi:hypothetical protein
MPRDEGPDPLIADAARLLDRTGRRLLGLCGPPAAGKSVLARALVDGINLRLGTDTAAYLPLDGFHLSNRQLERLGLTDRKGSPPSFDVYGYNALLRRVGADPAPGHDVYAPDYDRESRLLRGRLVPAGGLLLLAAVPARAAKAGQRRRSGRTARGGRGDFVFGAVTRYCLPRSPL